MKNDEQGPMENLLDGLDQHADALSPDEVKSELQERDIDVDAGVQEAEMTIAAYDKEDRLSWMKVADEKRASLRVAESAVVSWVGRKEEDIRAAFEAFLKRATPNHALAFRKKGELTVQDMAEILDADERLRQKSDDEGKRE
jgi:hypothetical protein